MTDRIAPAVERPGRSQVARIVFDAIEAQRGMPRISDLYWRKLMTEGTDRLAIMERGRVQSSLDSAFVAADRILALGGSNG